MVNFKKIARIGVATAGVALLFFLLRLFFIVSCHVPTDSMKPTILVGDYLLVNKMIPGMRLNRGGEVVRLKGFRSIKKNDILLFNYPYQDINSKGEERVILNRNVFYIKRCLAVPKDTFYIENAECKVKGYEGVLGVLEKQQELFEIPAEKISPERYRCFPHDTVDYAWNIKQFGYLYIPGKGDTVRIDCKNIKLYKNIIAYETALAIVVKDSTVYLGEEVLQQYTFKKNYYFMAGDHVQFSHDSRYWGLLPEDHIVGKAFFIWKSINKRSKKLRWSRMFEAL